MDKQLFLLPYAGGSSYIYKKFEQQFTKNIKITYIELPGRGMRKKEAFYDSLDDAVEQLSLQIFNLLQSKEFYLFGHSLGAILAYYISYEMYLRAYAIPRKIFLSGRTSPEYKFHVNIDSQSSTKIIYELKTLGCETSIYENSRVSNYYLNILKKDYDLINSISSEKVKENPIEATIFWSKEDKYCYDIKSWNKFLFHTPVYIERTGNHYCINDELFELLNKHIEGAASFDKDSC